MGVLTTKSYAQSTNFKHIRGEVNFDSPIRQWDGFGVNYVQTAQTLDLEKDFQDYGGFSLLNEQQKSEIIELIFGKQGLKPGLLKMFLDPWHQQTSGGVYDHETTTKQILEFATKGNDKTKENNRELKIITTLYGPPAYVTLQKKTRGRDLDPNHKQDLIEYYVDWVEFLANKKNLPVKYVSLHNEGEGWRRWELDGVSHENGNIGHDYNMYWPPEQVANFLKLIPNELKKRNLNSVKVTPGETFGWDRFYRWGYASEIAHDKEALDGLGLITSHSFLNFGYHRWNSLHSSAGIDLLRSKKEDLHAWSTSTSWAKMDSKFAWEIYSNIYMAKVNGIIPWAAIQVPDSWYGKQGDPNPGCAIWVKKDGSYHVRQGYFIYKQFTTAGQPGMNVVETMAQEQEIAIIGFGKGDTKNPDSFIVINIDEESRNVDIAVSGTKAKSFKAVRTLDPNPEDKKLEKERYSEIGLYKVEDGSVIYKAPAFSVTTFYGE